MSGGSYNYLCYKGPSELLDSGHADLESMALRLAGLGYATDAARETEKLLLILRQTEVQLAARINRLSAIWHAIEWWDSCDSGEDEVKFALEQYRQKGAGV